MIFRLYKVGNNSYYISLKRNNKKRYWWINLDNPVNRLIKEIGTKDLVEIYSYMWEDDSIDIDYNFYIGHYNVDTGEFI